MHALRIRFCRRAALLGAFALLFQAWLPLVHHPATLFAPNGDETETFDRLFDQAMVLCTAAGLVQKDIPAGGPAPAHHPSPCPICQSLHACGNFTAPNEITLLDRVIAPQQYKEPVSVSRTVARFEPAARPRAPPDRV